MNDRFVMSLEKSQKTHIFSYIFYIEPNVIKHNTNNDNGLYVTIFHCYLIVNIIMILNCYIILIYNGISLSLIPSLFLKRHYIILMII